MTTTTTTRGVNKNTNTNPADPFGLEALYKRLMANVAAGRPTMTDRVRLAASMVVSARSSVF